jgi:hypothetical protein
MRLIGWFLIVLGALIVAVVLVSVGGWILRR